MLYTKKFGIVVLCLLLAVAAFAIGTSVYTLNVSENQRSIFSGGNVESFSAGWSNEYGLSFDVSKLSTRRVDFDENNPLVVSRTVPRIAEDYALFFRSDNLRVNVYIDDVLVKSTDELFDTLRLDTYQAYYYIPVSESDAGKEIKLELYKTEYAPRYGLDNVYFGTAYAVTLKIISGEMVPLILSVCILVAGIVFVLCGEITRKLLTHYRGMVCYGLACIFISLWFICGSLWFYHIFNNIILAETCRNVFLLAAIPCMLLYIFENYKIAHVTLMKVNLLLSMALFFTLTALDLTGILSFGKTAFIRHIYLFFAGIVVIVEMVDYLSKVNGSKDGSKVFYTAVIFFVVFGFFDILSYYQGNDGDFSSYTRLGVFVLTVATAAASSGEVALELKKGIKAGKIGKMAYTDANTGIANSTAFKQKMEDLEQTKSRYQYIAIVQFDVNNLKIINDTKGHEAGDLLIKTAAQIIDTSFGTIGTCYRTGGDEFVAITTYNHAPLECEKAINKFDNLINQFNQNPDKPFDLRIAFGIAYYRGSDNTMVTLKEIHKLADERMYQNKKELKARFAKTPEEAVIR